MLFDGKIKTVELTDDFRKAYDTKWKQQNVMATLEQLEKKYGKDVFNEMVKLYLRENPID